MLWGTCTTQVLCTHPLCSCTLQSGTVQLHLTSRGPSRLDEGQQGILRVEQVPDAPVKRRDGRLGVFRGVDARRLQEEVRREQRVRACHTLLTSVCCLFQTKRMHAHMHTTRVYLLLLPLAHQFCRALKTIRNACAHAHLHECLPLLPLASELCK